MSDIIVSRDNKIAVWYCFRAFGSLRINDFHCDLIHNSLKFTKKCLYRTDENAFSIHFPFRWSIWVRKVFPIPRRCPSFTPISSGTSVVLWNEHSKPTLKIPNSVINFVNVKSGKMSWSLDWILKAVYQPDSLQIRFLRPILDALGVGCRSRPIGSLSQNPFQYLNFQSIITPNFLIFSRRKRRSTMFQL